jgi:peroxiredoxin
MNRWRRLGKLGGFAALSIAILSGSVRADLPLDRAVGQRLADFTLKNTEGDPVRLYGFYGSKAVVIVFLSTSCPVGNAYLPRLNEMVKAYEDKGVVFLGINSNPSETLGEIGKHKKEYGLTFPVLRDKDNLVADLAFAERTPEVLVLDGTARIRYRGAIDDQYFAGGKRREKPEHEYLKDAIEAVLSKKNLTVTSTAVEGCPIEQAERKVATPKGERVRGPQGELVKVYAERDAAAGKIEVGKVTYASDVATIIQNRCQTCHRPGQSAPFTLASYDDARRHSAGIAEVVEERRMPPWHADPRHGKFANDRSLTPKERATLMAWVDQGTPLGDPAKMPAPRRFVDGWTIGKPDLVIDIPHEYVVPAQGTVEYVYMKVPTGFTEDKWIQAAEAVPGDRSVVHHIVVFVKEPGGQRGQGEGPGSHLCGYAPGDMPSIYPLGSAKRIPAGSELIFQLHYTPNGKARVDRSRLGLIFAKAPVEHEAHTRGIAQTRFQIAPGDDNAEVKSSLTTQKDVTLLAFMPHMHLRGKDFKYTVTFPDGKSQVLLSVPAYDFGWQSYYTLEKPIKLPKGTRIDCVAHYDNSAKNPANPDPTKTVTWGDQTHEEMMIGYIDYIDNAKVGEKVAQTPLAQPRPNRGATLIRRAAQVLRRPDR